VSAQSRGHAGMDMLVKVKPDHHRRRRRLAAG
jgi:hypothetical protein